MGDLATDYLPLTELAAALRRTPREAGRKLRRAGVVLHVHPVDRRRRLVRRQDWQRFLTPVPASGRSRREREAVAVM